ncbi:MAG: SMC-Scp complex subunit ScpB [Candidatus Magasanikbacteria bacterium CG11_big_fil_rev_8_21_14_0_20_39_34]|uniref:SMC-Scp complex subunit ScpB n=1 Tax=Candidatus Magasanikbacteria bacterium CG11_big_fil_rev_8_21_14_0_20_39_34 TaxID=1974653 RepID=A0A2H0N694_9BACT|nr:MAG: SMC-Scp complex subunit ScpB [Candidatus Magasanikbacteria bacterium CG11_big_fil_rev_8_21_14_0_20_39_34]
MEIIPRIESILFVASKPLRTDKIAKALEVSVGKVEEAIKILEMKFNRDDSGIHILCVENTVQMSTHPGCADVIEGFVKDEIAGELTRAQLETLTVVAYRGPITRPELEQIRGVNCSVILRNLMMRGLIDEREEKESLMPVYTLTVEALAHLGVEKADLLPDYNTLKNHEYIENVLQEES